MNEPIKVGDKCTVIGGLARGKSPNIGLVVDVVSLQGEHSQHGRVWRCTGTNIKQLADNGMFVKTGWADFPQSWLQKVDEVEPKQKTKSKELVE
jgi:hypothetical protein